MRKVIPPDATLIPDNATKVYDGIIHSVYTWPQKLYDGTTTTFEMLKRVDTVKVIGVVGDQILTIEEDQPGAPSRGYELPGGRVEKDAHDLLSEAKRELLEETGYQFQNWRLVLVQQINQHTEGFFFYYLATDGRKVQKVTHDAGEHIRQKLVSYQELLRGGTVGPNASMWYLARFFEPIKSLENLLKVPEFKGKEVDR